MTEHDKRHPLQPTTSMLRVLKSQQRREESGDIEPESEPGREVFERVQHVIDADDLVRPRREHQQEADSGKIRNGPAHSSSPTERAPITARFEATEPAGRPSANHEAQANARQESRQPREEAEHRDSERADIGFWWVSFSGNVSLNRLSRVRQRLLESPFTIESRFDEIGDGVVAMRVVTDANLTTQHLEWIIGQLLETEGMDRNAAIVSAD